MSVIAGNIRRENEMTARLQACGHRARVLIREDGVAVLTLNSIPQLEREIELLERDSRGLPAGEKS